MSCPHTPTPEPSARICTALRRLVHIILLVVASGVTCSERVCPTIGCQPQVQLTYENSISGTYHLYVNFHGVVFETDCPKAITDRTIGIKACDADGFLVTGVDLGHASNDTLDLLVSIDGAMAMSVTATLHGILNSRDCETVCFDHRGTVAN
jgi:hypothetical protein